MTDLTMAHLVTIYDEQLRRWLTARGFRLGWIPRTIVVEEDFWEDVNRERKPGNSIEEALRTALQKGGEPPPGWRIQ
jgi:hypothetical protein